MTGGRVKNRGVKFPKQRLRDSYAFVVDGNDEKWYLDLLKLHERGVRVDIKPELSGGRTIREQYDLVRELASSYTKVFWVIDLDVVIKQDREWRAQSGRERPSDTLRMAISTIEKWREDKKVTNIFTVVNTPGLEYWFLLHLEQTSRYYETCKEVIDRLRDLSGSPLQDYNKSEKYYKKPNDDIYTKLKPYLATARANGAKLGGFDPEKMLSGLSEMYVIFDELKL